jgi:MinD superfamily P-loop ATPase
VKISATMEAQMYEEKGVRMYSAARTHKSGYCDICFQCAEVCELESADIHASAKRIQHSFTLCFACTARIVGLFAPHNQTKELYCGTLQTREDGGRDSPMP